MIKEGKKYLFRNLKKKNNEQGCVMCMSRKKMLAI